MVTPIETCPDAEAERAEAVRIVPKTHLTFIVLLAFCSGLLAQTCMPPERFTGDWRSGKNCGQIAQTFHPRCVQTPFSRLQSM
jgi:hypothetical protein